MTGNEKSTKPVENNEVDAEEAKGSSDSAEPQVRHPRDTSGEIIAVDVEPAEESEPAGEASPDGDAEATGPEPEPESEPEPEPEPEVDPVTQLEAELDKKQNQLLRVAADFDNYKKRSRRDAREAAFRARNELLQELLPIIDNVELALSHATETSEGETDAKSLREGVEMVLRQFHTTMEKYEVKAFDSLGEPFDPNFHEALQQRETDEHPPGAVIEEYRRGYLMGDRLIRPAMVVVASAPAGGAPADVSYDDDDDTEKGNEE